MIEPFPVQEVVQNIVQEKPGFVTISRLKLRELQEMLKQLGFVCEEEVKIIEGWLT